MVGSESLAEERTSARSQACLVEGALESGAHFVAGLPVGHF